MAIDGTYQPAIYKVQGGSELVVASGGQITIQSGGIVKLETGGLMTVNASNLDVAELAYLDGLTAGAAMASKAAVLDANKTLRIGGFNAAAALTLAVPFTASLDFYADGQVDILSVFGGSGANLTSAKSAKCGRFRHVVNCTTAAHETYGLVGQLVARDTTLTHLHAGLMGTFEGNTSGVVCNSSYLVGHAAVIARIGGHAFITATTPLAGFLAFNNQSAGIGGGSAGTAAFATSMFSASYPWTVGLYIPADSCTTAIDARGLVTVALTITSSTPATARLIRSELTVTPATSVAVGSNGSLAAVRGCVTLTTGKTISDGYLYGMQGKLVLDGAIIAVGSDHITPVYGQLSASGSTFTSGHIAAIIADIQAVPTSSLVDLFYGESVTGNVINAMFKAIAKSDYVFDVSSNVHTQMSTTGTVGATASKGWLKVLVEGAVRYIPLADSVT